MKGRTEYIIVPLLPNMFMQTPAIGLPTRAPKFEVEENQLFCSWFKWNSLGTVVLVKREPAGDE